MSAAVPVKAKPVQPAPVQPAAKPVQPAKVAETPEQELLRLREENARLKAGRRGPLSMKVSDKGALSVYGLGRFPTTLYKEQWLRLLDAGEDIRSFIEANQDQLAVKAV